MSIEELKEIIFQNRCVFLYTKQPCLSDDMSANGCKECSDKIVDEIVEKIRADERAKVIEEFANAIKEYVKNTGTIPNNFNCDKIASRLKEE